MHPVKQFAIAPSTDELASVRRQIVFHPSRNPSPARLDEEQLALFNTRGYLAGIRIFAEDEIVAIRAKFDDLLRRVLDEGGDSYSISSAHLQPRVRLTTC